MSVNTYEHDRGMTDTNLQLFENGISHLRRCLLGAVMTHHRGLDFCKLGVFFKESPNVIVRHDRICVAVVGLRDRTNETLRARYVCETGVHA